MKNKETIPTGFEVKERNSFSYGISAPYHIEFEQILSAVQLRPRGESELLGGRTPVVYTQLGGVGNVVVKSYRRGGLLGLVNGSWHCRYTNRVEGIRSAHEFLMLQRVRKLGIGAPEPLVWIAEGKFFYKAWLITREIEGAQTLAKIALEDRDKAAQYMHALEPIVYALIQNRIFHVDFHAGNVVLDGQNNLQILDFDCAYIFTGSLNRLRDLYLRRWRRAAIKHKLPDELSEIMCSSLRRNFVDSNATQSVYHG